MKWFLLVCFISVSALSASGESLHELKVAADGYKKTGQTFKFMKVSLQIGTQLDAMGQAKMAAKAYKKVYKVYVSGKFAPGCAESIAAGEALFRLAESYSDSFNAVTLTQTSDINTFKKQLMTKMKHLKQAEQLYRKVLSMKAGCWVVASLYQMGMMYAGLHTFMSKALPPQNLSSQQQEQYKAQFEKIAKPYTEKAAQLFTAAVKQATELKTPCPWEVSARSALTKLKSGLPLEGGDDPGEAPGASNNKVQKSNSYKPDYHSSFKLDPNVLPGLICPSGAPGGVPVAGLRADNGDVVILCGKSLGMNSVESWDVSSPALYRYNQSTGAFTLLMEASYSWRVTFDQKQGYIPLDLLIKWPGGTKLSPVMRVSYLVCKKNKPCFTHGADLCLMDIKKSLFTTDLTNTVNWKVAVEQNINFLLKLLHHAAAGDDKALKFLREQEGVFSKSDNYNDPQNIINLVYWILEVCEKE